jgi:HlyD family secretion protein
MKRLIMTLILLAVVAGSVGAYYKYGRPEEVTQFSYLAVTRGDVVESVGATGTLQAVRTVMVGSQVSGRIKALHADFNKIVRKGQVIAELDPSLFQTQVEQAKANLSRSQTDRDRLKITLEDSRNKLKRTQSLFDRKIATQQDLETAEVNVRSAEASLKSSEASIVQSQASLNQTQVSLDNTIILAPIDGIVISRNVDVGQTVAASMNAPTIFIIAGDLTQMQVIANVDESDVGRMRPNQVVRFRVDAFPGEEFLGAVSQVRLNPIVAQNVVTYATVIDVPNPQLKLKLGMTANVTIEIAKKTDVLRVPNAALRYRPGADIFADLNVPVPPELLPRAGGRGGQNAGSGGGGRMTDGQGGSAASQTAGRGIAAIADAKPGAQTIDQLFGALPPTVTRGRAWIHVGGQLKSVQLRLGISDGTWTELLSDEIKDGHELVTNIVTPAMAAAAANRPGGQPNQNQQQGRTANPFQGGGAGSHGGGAPH